MKNAAKLIKGLIFKNRPLYVHYGTTHRCNLHCRMCKIDRRSSNQEELSVGQIREVFGILKRLGAVYVSIGGGEPVLRTDLSVIIELLVKMGFTVRLLTNGTLVNEQSVHELVLAGLREVSVSLDTLDRPKFSYICDQDNIWDKVMRSIDLFANILPKNGRLLLINTVVSSMNIKELPELSRFAKSKGYYISFVPIEADRNSEFRFKEDEHRLIDESYNYLLRAKKKSKSPIFNSSLFLERSREYLKTQRHDWQCDAGRLYLSLNPAGEVSICHQHAPEISLLKNDCATLLKSRLFKKKRTSLIAGCAGCMRPCWAEVSFLFRNPKCLYEMAKIRLG